MSFAGFRFATIDDVSADERLGLVLRRDARDDLALLGRRDPPAAASACWTSGRVGRDDLRRHQAHLLELLDSDLSVRRETAWVVSAGGGAGFGAAGVGFSVIVFSFSSK